MQLKNSLKQRVLRNMALTVGGMLTALSVQAQTINLSYNGAPDADKNAVHMFASNFKKLVEDKTNGDLEIKLYPNSMLGEEQERMEQVMYTPSLNVASFAGIAPQFPEIYVSAIPFMFNDFSAAHRFFDEGDYWKQAQTTWRERTGTELLSVVEEGGFLAFTNNQRQIKSPADFDGLRFRAMDPSQVALYESFGASGTPIPWTEVYMALKTGVADGQMNPPMYIIMGSLYEVQKYMTLANIQYSDQFLVANGDLLKNLSDEQRTALEDAARQATEMNRKAVEAEVENRITYLKDQGMEVYTPNKEEMAQFQQVGQPSYLKWLKEQNIDSSWIDTALEDAGLR
ncbi:TRAP transporter substrate-binding protein DctP [Terasakiispira papahanaumokuakeensis]